MNRALLLLSGILLVIGCGGGSSDTQSAEGSETSGDETSSANHDTCVAFFTHQRECGDDFLPALVALRVRLDRPAGIAAQGPEWFRSVGTEKSPGTIVCTISGAVIRLCSCMP